MVVGALLFLQMLSSKDINFVGYTYKNFEIVGDPEVPGIGNFSLSVDINEDYLAPDYVCRS